jgi:hypothetical protein
LAPATNESDDVPEARELGYGSSALRGSSDSETWVKRDEPDGKLKLIEYNLPPTAADPMTRAGGLDRLALLYDRTSGGPALRWGVPA